MARIDFITVPGADYTPTKHGGSFGKWFGAAMDKRNRDLVNSIPNFDRKTGKVSNITDAIDSITPVGGAVKIVSKLDDVLAKLSPGMKMRGDQLGGYLRKKGVSPKEIEASGMADDLVEGSYGSIENFIRKNPGRNKLRTSELKYAYDDITMQQGGVDNPSYKVDITDIEGRRDKPAKSHFGAKDKTVENLGWRRSHIKDVNGKPTLVLDEIQSDWAQAERQGQGAFAGKLKRDIDNFTPEQMEEFDFIKNREYNSNAIEDEMFKFEDAKHAGRALPYPQSRYDTLTKVRDRDNKKYFDLLKQEPELPTVNAASRDQKMAIDDFPMKQETFFRNQIGMAIDDAEKAGVSRVLIPMKREGEDLAGKPGVTTFYENLEKGILPDLKKKLEKQGYQLNITNELVPPGKPTLRADSAEMIADNISDNLGSEEYERLLAWAPADVGTFESPFTLENIRDVIAGKPGTRPEFADHIRGATEFLKSDVFEEVAPSNVGHLIEILKIPSNPASLSSF